MPSKTLRQEIKHGIFAETLRRYPHEVIPPDTQTAWIDDWTEIAERVGLERFVSGVKRARSYSNFFPKIAEIEPLIPEQSMRDGAKWNQELRELQRRKLAGEKFYTLGDVFSAVASLIRTGKIKPSNPSWFEWAKQWKGK